MFNVCQDTMRTSTKKRINFSLKNIMKKLNAIAHEINAIQTIQDLKLMIKFNEKILKILVNLKVTSNFISQFIVNKY